MTELPFFSAIIFDLDGLVLDTESTYFAAWQQAASLMGFNFTDAFCKSLSGLHYKDIEQKLLAAFGEQFDLQTFAAQSSSCWRQVVSEQGITVKAGFKQLLAVLKELGLPYALATNSPLLNALECLALAGLAGVFVTLIARDHVAEGKPEPDIFYYAAQQLKLPIQHCLVLEDSYSGVLGAFRAGASVVYIPSGEIVPEAEAMSICSASDLSQLAERITQKFS